VRFQAGREILSVGTPRPAGEGCVGLRVELGEVEWEWALRRQAGWRVALVVVDRDRVGHVVRRGARGGRRGARCGSSCRVCCPGLHGAVGWPVVKLWSGLTAASREGTVGAARYGVGGKGKGRWTPGRSGAGAARGLGRVLGLERVGVERTSSPWARLDPQHSGGVARSDTGCGWTQRQLFQHTTVGLGPWWPRRVGAVRSGGGGVRRGGATADPAWFFASLRSISGTGTCR